MTHKRFSEEKVSQGGKRNKKNIGINFFYTNRLYDFRYEKTT